MAHCSLLDTPLPANVRHSTCGLHEGGQDIQSTQKKNREIKLPMQCAITNGRICLIFKC